MRSLSRLLDRAAVEGVPAAGNRLDAVFARSRPALICYLPLGDPALELELPELYAEAGVDVLEIGVPGGAPALDGPTIADSLARAAAAGVTSTSAAETIASWRKALPDQAMVWMTYPRDGAGELIDKVAAAGVDGLLLPTPARRFPVLSRQLERRVLAVAVVVAVADVARRRALLVPLAELLAQGELSTLHPAPCSLNLAL